MNILVALKILYYIIVLAPILATIIYLFLGILALKNQKGNEMDFFSKFLCGVGALISYGITYCLMLE